MENKDIYAISYFLLMTSYFLLIVSVLLKLGKTRKEKRIKKERNARTIRSFQEWKGGGVSISSVLGEKLIDLPSDTHFRLSSGGKENYLLCQISFFVQNQEVKTFLIGLKDFQTLQLIFKLMRKS